MATIFTHFDRAKKLKLCNDIFLVFCASKVVTCVCVCVCVCLCMCVNYWIFDELALVNLFTDLLFSYYINGYTIYVNIMTRGEIFVHLGC